MAQEKNGNGRAAPPTGRPERWEERAFEVRAARAEDGKTVTLEGYASVFNVLSEDLGGWKERVLPGSFAHALQDPDTKFLVNHRDLPLAAYRSGDLELEEDATGLFMRATLEADDPDVDRVVRKIKPGKLDKMSIAFTVRSDRVLRENGELIREVMEFDELFDVSVVTFPAFPDTTIAKRSIEELLQREAEEMKDRGREPADTDLRRRELDLAATGARARGLV